MHTVRLHAGKRVELAVQRHGLHTLLTDLFDIGIDLGLGAEQAAVTGDLLVGLDIDFDRTGRQRGQLHVDTVLRRNGVAGIDLLGLLETVPFDAVVLVGFIVHFAIIALFIALGDHQAEALTGHDLPVVSPFGILVGIDDLAVFVRNRLRTLIHEAGMDKVEIARSELLGHRFGNHPVAYGDLIVRIRRNFDMERDVIGSQVGDGEQLRVIRRGEIQVHHIGELVLHLVSEVNRVFRNGLEAGDVELVHTVGEGLYLTGGINRRCGGSLRIGLGDNVRILGDGSRGERYLRIVDADRTQFDLERGFNHRGGRISSSTLSSEHPVNPTPVKARANATKKPKRCFM